MRSQRGFISILIVVLIGLAVLGGGAYYVVQQQTRTQTASENLTSKPQITSTSPDVDGTENWKTYRNSKFSFELKYPSDMTVSEESGSNPQIGDDWTKVILQGDDLSLIFFSGVSSKGGPGEGWDVAKTIKSVVVSGEPTVMTVFSMDEAYQATHGDNVLVSVRTKRGYDNFYSNFSKSKISVLLPKIESIVATFKYTDSALNASAVKKVNWNIEKANPAIVDDNDYRKSEQAISIDVTLTDNSTKRYSLGTAYGCAGSNVQLTQDNKNILGKVSCYFSLTGVGFLAYTQKGLFVVERQDESAKDGSIKTTVLLEI